MLRTILAGLVVSGLISACTAGTATSDPISSDAGGGGGSGACPNLAGMWTVKNHCDPTLVGDAITVTQMDCTLTFSSPFNGFTATVTSDNKVSVSGPQTCTGTTTHSSIDMTCTPGTCAVKLTR